MDEIKIKRVKAIEKKYKPIIDKYNRFIEVIETIEIRATESLEDSIVKLYLITNNIGETMRTLNKMGYRKDSITIKEERKITRQDIMKELREIDRKDKNKYRNLAREQYKDNGGLINQ